MTDEKIKGELDKWTGDGDFTTDERKFMEQYSAADQFKAAVFYAGFRAAERIAKIDVLEKLLINMESLSTQSAITTIDNMLSELKAGQ